MRRSVVSRPAFRYSHCNFMPCSFRETLIYIFKAICVVQSTMFCIYMQLRTKSSIRELPSGFVTSSGRSRLLNPCYIPVRFIQQSVRNSFGNASVFFNAPFYCFLFHVVSAFAWKLFWWTSSASPHPLPQDEEQGTAGTATLMLLTPLSCFPLSSLCSAQPEFSPWDGFKLKHQLLLPFSNAELCAVHAIYSRLLFIAKLYYLACFECKLHFQLSTTDLLYHLPVFPVRLSKICSQWWVSYSHTSGFLHVNWLHS